MLVLYSCITSKGIFGHFNLNRPRKITQKFFRFFDSIAYNEYNYNTDEIYTMINFPRSLQGLWTELCMRLSSYITKGLEPCSDNNYLARISRQNKIRYKWPSIIKRNTIFPSSMRIEQCYVSVPETQHDSNTWTKKNDPHLFQWFDYVQQIQWRGRCQIFSRPVDRVVYETFIIHNKGPWTL